MRFQYAFRHFDVSPALIAYTEKKILEEVNKFATKPIEASLTFAVNRHEHSVHCLIVGGDGFNLQVESVSEDMYQSVDLLVDKLVTQLRKVKEKLKHHKTKGGRFAKLEGQKSDDVSIDAEDILKYEQARRARSG